MFKNALVFVIDHWEPPTLPEMETRLDGARFVECGATQPESVGWVPPRGDRHAALAESVGGQVLLRLCTETKAVPGGVVKAALQAELDKAEEATGRRPKGKMALQMKEEIIQTLLPRAFPQRRHTGVWLDAKAGRVLIDASSMKKADAVITRLTELLGGGLRLSPLQTEWAPATAMATWLTEKEAPAGFTLDRDCELKQPDSEKATVRYARHTLDIDEVGEHIKAGKLPTQLALTWAGRVSFVLTETLALKKIKLLDVVLESAGRDGENSGKADFDTDAALFTGEMTQLLVALVDALGGPLQPPGAAAAPAPASAAASDRTSVGQADGPASSATAPPPAPTPSVAPWEDLPG